MEHPDHIAARMTRNSVLLGTFATALSLDLAVAPMVIITPPGVGVLSTLRNVSPALGMGFLDLRLATIAPGDDLGSIDEVLDDSFASVIVLDEAGSASGEMLDGVLKRIVDSARAPVVVALIVRPGEENNALDAIVRTLGIESVDVPTDTLIA